MKSKAALWNRFTFFLFYLANSEILHKFAAEYNKNCDGKSH